MSLRAEGYLDDSRELTEAVGRLLLVGFEGWESAEIERLATEVRPAGLIFFKRNYPPEDGPRALKALIDSTQALAEGVLGRRLFMAIDHEGGQVQRLPAPYAPLPAAGALAGIEAAAAAAWQGAKELAATGFNLNLAPVLDLADPTGSFMGDRAFSADPSRVTSFGRATLAAFHQAGILGAGKHFPGLGAAASDPHHNLPVIAVDVRRLAEMELTPYQALAAEGSLAAVMTTHALYPALDAGRPATFSEEIVGLLKDEMGFGGAVLTDDLEMGAVARNYPLGEAAVSAVRAGHDLVLICRHREYIDECRQALALAVRNGTISETRLAGALDRTELLSRRLERFQPDQTVLAGWFDDLLAAGKEPETKREHHD